MFTRRRIVTLLIALAGVAVFKLLRMPLPFLFGPLAACLLAALRGVKLQGMGQVSRGARTVVGVTVGASITPEVAHNLHNMAASMMLIPLYILMIGLIGVPFFHRICKFDPVTSFYAAMPGGLQDMVAFGFDSGGDVRALSLVHATRVLIVVTLAPFVLTHAYGMVLTRPIGVPISTLPYSEMAIMLFAAVVGWKGGEKLGLFGASILGPMILTAILSLTQVVHFRPPAEAILTAQVFVGMGIGVHYVGVTMKELRIDVSAGVAYAFILALMAWIFTTAVTKMGFAPPASAFLAFSPGGQAEMTLLAIVGGADLGFVVVHHTVRIILVIVGAPVVARYLRKHGKMN
jgi:membrane AbrB-like protein